MNHLKNACTAFVLLDDKHKNSLFKLLVRAHCMHISASPSTHEVVLKEGDFDTSKAKETATSLFLNEPACRNKFLKSLLQEDCSTRETIEWAISLIKDVDYNINIKAQTGCSYSDKELIDIIISAVDKELFDTVMKCYIDWHMPNIDLLNSQKNTYFSTLFLDALSSACEALENNQRAAFIFDHILNLPIPTENDALDDISKRILSADKDASEEPYVKAIIKQRYRQALCSALNSSINSAAALAKNGYLLSDFDEDDFIYKNSDYVTEAITKIYKGFGAEILLNGTTLEGYSKPEVEKERDDMLAILETLRSDDAMKKEHLLPFFVKESVMGTLSFILKEASQEYGVTSNVNTDKQTSSFLSFFEEIIGVESIAFNDNNSTKMLLQLSKTNYGVSIVSHYINKFDMQYFAKHAGGIEQARFVTREFNSDPLTVLQYVRKESVKRQLMEDLASS